MKNLTKETYGQYAINMLTDVANRAKVDITDFRVRMSIACLMEAAELGHFRPNVDNDEEKSHKAVIELCGPVAGEAFGLWLDLHDGCAEKLSECDIGHIIMAIKNMDDDTAKAIVLAD